MPKYAYECQNCIHAFEIYHSMSEKLLDCPECQITGSLAKIPSLTQSFADKEKKSSKPGKIVNSYIQDAKQELKKQKQKLKKVEY